LGTILQPQFGSLRSAHLPALVGDARAASAHTPAAFHAQAADMITDDLKKLANAIFCVESEEQMYRLLAPLTAEETEELAQLIEMGTMKAWVGRELAKGRPQN
jgi:hypothetical protein